jgi:hypothetical protein
MPPARRTPAGLLPHILPATSGQTQKEPPAVLKKLTVIGFAASIGFAPIVLAPMAAMAQPVTPPIRPAGTAKPATVIPAATAKARECANEADAKGLKGGEPRKKFIAECKKS